MGLQSVCSNTNGRRELGRQPIPLEVEDLITSKRYQLITVGQDVWPPMIVGTRYVDIPSI